MRLRHIYPQVFALALILVPATVGMVAVRASATCQRYVRNYITTPVRNRVSKVTTAAWAEWRASHPVWKPSPAVQRPKYVMTRKEAVQKVNFACEIDTFPLDIDLTLTPPPPVDLPILTATQINFPEPTPPVVAEVVIPPVVPIALTANTPEPSSLLLVSSGVALSLLFWMRRRSTGV
ncbi:MAG: PEP-CTERM sorting domain-containing protein [Acidobacteriaceae bacterium]|nr:PEP-CTERM sorting domain-containing protein [Acidobacteriaceae bacterium]